MRPALAVLVARYDALGNAITRLRESIRAIETAHRVNARAHPRGRQKALPAAATRQLQQLRCALDALIAQRDIMVAEIVACASTMPAFIHVQATRGIGPIRAARLLTPCIVPRCHRAIDAFDEKRQFDQIVAAISGD